jgi:hypothetical protein
MKGKQNSLALLVLAFLVLSLLVASPSWAQGRGARGVARPMAQGTQAAPNPLGMLERALQQVGATALSSDQVTQLTSLVTSFRSNLPKPGQDATLISAQTAYDNDVLSGNSSDAATQAGIIAAENSKLESARLQAEANSEISALGILTSDQITALQSKLGTTGLVRVLGTLFGGPGMFNGPRGRGAGAAALIRR